LSPTYDAEQPSSFRSSFITQQIFKGEFRSCKDQFIEADLHCLIPGNKLTDTVVKFYSNLSMNSFNDISILDPHFYTLTLKHPDQRLYYFNNFNFFHLRLLFIPVLENDHWKLVANFIDRMIAVYDSLVQIIN